MKRSVRNKNWTITLGIILGVVASLIISTATTSLLVLMIQNKTISESGTTFYFAIRFLSVILGCLFGTQLHKENKIVMIALITIAYFAFMTCMGALFFDGKFQHIGSGLLSSIFGGVIALMIRMKSQKRKIKVYNITK